MGDGATDFFAMTRVLLCRRNLCGLWWFRNSHMRWRYQILRDILGPRDQCVSLGNLRLLGYDGPAYPDWPTLLGYDRPHPIHNLTRQQVGV